MTSTLPTTSAFDPIFYVAGRNDLTGGNIFKAAVYNATTEAVPVKLTFEGVDLEVGTEARLTVLTGPEGDPMAYNDPATGINVVKTTTSTVVVGEDGAFEFSLPDLSVAVLDTAVSAEVK